MKCLHQSLCEYVLYTFWQWFQQIFSISINSNSSHLKIFQGLLFPQNNFLEWMLFLHLCHLLHEKNYIHKKCLDSRYFMVVKHSHLFFWSILSYRIPKMFATKWKVLQRKHFWRLRRNWKGSSVVVSSPPPQCCKMVLACNIHVRRRQSLSLSTVLFSYS